PFVRIWHAGCSTGEEVYSLAIVLHEEGLYDRCRIYATDLCDTVLDRARKGIFPARAMKAYAEAYERAGGKEDFSQYYTADVQHAMMRTGLRRNLVFSQHNLVCDAPFNEFHLIVCRNVAIYFNRKLRDRVFSLFHDSLSHFGLLALGKKESLEGTAHENAYQEIETGSRVFRRTK
ncbi:MAG TPA: CheR family methyltransferase, partial [Polyangiales bacterium]|nr:CheR family methyltransferase [Polyangiales bacterium]